MSGILQTMIQDLHESSWKEILKDRELEKTLDFVMKNPEQATTMKDLTEEEIAKRLASLASKARRRSDPEKNKGIAKILHGCWEALEKDNKKATLGNIKVYLLNKTLSKEARIQQFTERILEKAMRSPGDNGYELGFKREVTLTDVFVFTDCRKAFVRRPIRGK